MIPTTAVAFILPYSHFLLLVFVSIGLVVDILIEGGQQNTLSIGKDLGAFSIVPGNTNTRLCPDPHQHGDLFTVESVWISPWPAKAGQRHTVEIAGYFRENLDSKARLLVEAHYKNNRTVALAESYDLCSLGSFLGEDDQTHCPPRKGRTVIHYEPYIPWFAKSESIWGQIWARTEDHRRIFCLDTTVDLIGND